ATPTTATYTLSLHDALPISNQTGCRIPIRGNLMRNLILTVPQIGVRNLVGKSAPIPHGTHPLPQHNRPMVWKPKPVRASDLAVEDRKSTRLNSSHVKTSYAV